MLQFLRFLVKGWAVVQKTTNEKQRKIPSLLRKLDLQYFPKWNSASEVGSPWLPALWPYQLFPLPACGQDQDLIPIHQWLWCQRHPHCHRRKKRKMKRSDTNEEHGHWRHLPGSGDSPLFQFFHGWCDVACGDHVDSVWDACLGHNRMQHIRQQAWNRGRMYSEALDPNPPSLPGCLNCMYYSSVVRNCPNLAILSAMTKVFWTAEHIHPAAYHITIFTNPFYTF